MDAATMTGTNNGNSFTRKISFFRTILIPFMLISIFAQVYSNSFLVTFLVDNSPAVALARTSGVNSSKEITAMMANTGIFKQPATGNISISQKENMLRAQVSGELFAMGLRLASILLLYFWLRPFFLYFRKGTVELRPVAQSRYNNFYRAIFSYFFVTHLIMFVSSTMQRCLPEDLPSAAVYHLVWWVSECYLFYLFLEPSLFLYVSGSFVEKGMHKPGRTSLSIYLKLVTMLVFLALIPLAILAFCVHKEYFLLKSYQDNALILITTSAAFLIGNMQLLFKSIQEPLDFLGEKMHRLAGGDFNVQTSVLFDDEIGRLKLNFNLMVEQLKERDEIKDTFGKYVSIEIARHLIENRKVSLGGENITATILFSDIRNFTSMSESMSPEEVVSMLNTYFAFITSPIMENHGVINKFIGDAVMAVFTPHLGSENHVEDAIKSALGMRQRLAELNGSGRLKLPVQFGVGLNTGPLIAGNIGTEKRFEYTVIGDTVNVASRMESLSRTVGHDIIVSETTAELIPASLKEKLIVEITGPIQIKGKSQPASVYKLIGLKDPLA